MFDTYDCRSLQHFRSNSLFLYVVEIYSEHKKWCLKSNQHQFCSFDSYHSNKIIFFKIRQEMSISYAFESLWELLVIAIIAPFYANMKSGSYPLFGLTPDPNNWGQPRTWWSTLTHLTSKNAKQFVHCTDNFGHPAAAQKVCDANFYNNIFSMNKWSFFLETALEIRLKQ